MSQVVSRNINENKTRPAGSHILTTCRRTLVIAYHGAAASIYGFAIGWQQVSEASAQLDLRTNPLMRVYGRWRFLTYQCLIMQFVAYSLCFTAHFVPKLRRPRDYFFTTLAFPIGMLVVSSFWSIWFILGREYIQPVAMEPFYPPWLNHVTHTIIAPINLIELLLIKKQYPLEEKAVPVLTTYTLAYTSLLLYIRYQTGRFVYPFLNKMTPVPVGAFISSLVVIVVVYYKVGHVVHDFVHGVRSLKNKMLSGTRASGECTSKDNKKTK